MDYNLKPKPRTPVAPATPPQNTTPKTVDGGRPAKPAARPVAPAAVNATPAAVKATPAATLAATTDRPAGKEYTDVEMQEMLVGYFNIPRDMWDHIPSGAHIRFLKKDKGTADPRGRLFKPGGFVRSHFVGADGCKMMLVGSTPGARKPGDKTFPIAYDNVENIWKKYDHSSFIEWHMNTISLMQKNKRIEDLEARIKKLEDILRRVVGAK